MYSCFDDFQKAFDTVWRSGLFKKLSNMEIDWKKITILECVYSEVNDLRMLSCGLTDSISSNAGLNQGSFLSPILFNLYMRVWMGGLVFTNH